MILNTELKKAIRDNQSKTDDTERIEENERGEHHIKDFFSSLISEEYYNPMPLNTNSSV